MRGPSRLGLPGRVAGWRRGLGGPRVPSALLTGGPALWGRASGFPRSLPSVRLGGSGHLRILKGSPAGGSCGALSEGPGPPGTGGPIHWCGGRRPPFTGHGLVDLAPGLPHLAASPFVQKHTSASVAISVRARHHLAIGWLGGSAGRNVFSVCTRGSRCRGPGGPWPSGLHLYGRCRYRGKHV